LRISWLIVGMKPFTFHCGKSPRLLCPKQKREVLAATSHPGFTSLSNVQLLSGESDETLSLGRAGT
jgi:hypothetical protein